MSQQGAPEVRHMKVSLLTYLLPFISKVLQASVADVRHLASMIRGVAFVNVRRS
jgi:hypothetical protein